jgi:hypothetical protein
MPMTNYPPGACEVCGKPGAVHLAELNRGNKTQHSFCVDHAPPGLQNSFPFGSHRTPAEEVAFLRQKLIEIRNGVSDPTKRAEYEAAIEQAIADIEAGRKRLDQPGGANVRRFD